ncbi:NnrS family protein [Poseidonibacter lekithochrous]|uniref:NnrS family protein n=1 Tax=Poseidonibacter TaxID=2321187 RepID=UPI001C085B59|nr:MULTISPECIES: NnrS family protein [Poseidonibacter]MBU3013332.1 NnrS family protein [Poseidonibacter lekithochrous]MDO6826629.1 NnrS family protein [Poseidonibacter sp. 1_MG-2023]
MANELNNNQKLGNNEQPLHATNHYLHYPDEKNIPPYLAYGFRPIFLLLAPYMVISMILWGLIWSGVLTIPFMNDTLTWHIYEMLFGVLTAGVMAFLTTGIPELFPGMVPFVGRRLKMIVILWILSRISFWTIDITGIFLTAILNIGMLVWLLWFAKEAVLDPLQRHASLGYSLLLILVIEVWFFASKLGYASTDGLVILTLAVGAIVILILLALRRVNMEAVNELMEDKGIDDIYISRPPLTNLAIFCVAIFTSVEFLYPQNSALGWIGLATAASILALTSDYILKDKFILNQGYVIYLGLIPILLSLGYGLIGWDILNNDIYGINHFRHFITSGGIGLSYLIVMMIIGFVHTGRHLTVNIYTNMMVFLIVLATCMRSLIPFLEEFTYELYLYSSILWVIPFILYMKVFYSFLLNPRADGIKG